MSRLHCFMASPRELAAPFAASWPQDIAVPEQTVEGLKGAVILNTERGRSLRVMRWGFPRRVRGDGDGPDKIGLVADLTNPMWAEMVIEPRYRCIVPITHFANPDGPKGAKTRTWFSVKGQPVMAWAGICRNMPEVGPVYAGLTMDANSAVMPTNDRMPVLLEPNEVERWFTGPIEDVIEFQFRAPFAASRMIVEQTNDRWRGDGLPSNAFQQSLL